MKILSDYLNTLFLNLPQTPAVQKAKEDLRAIMEDHYNELLAEGKSEHEAIGAVISEFGSIDELLQELEVDQEATPAEQTAKFYQEDPIELVEMQDYWQEVRRFALKMAIGVGSLFCALDFAIFSDYTGDGTGIFFFFLSGIVGACFFIFGGIHFYKVYKVMGNRRITQEVAEAQENQIQKFQRSFSWSLVLGVSACIFAFLMPNVFYYSLLGPVLCLAFLGLGAFLIVYGSIVYGLYRKGYDPQTLSKNKSRL